MYEAFFNLQTRPFAAAPQLDHYFPGRTIEAARQALSRCIERAEGAGLVCGPSGTGKTLLVQTLARQFQPNFATAILAAGRLGTRAALLQAILFELGLPYRGLDESELRLSLFDYLSPSRSENEGLLLLVDEAHTLPLRLLDELRMITNLVRDGQPRVRLILSGSLLLEERFAHPKLDSFSQRLAARCYLEAFDPSETCVYVKFQISVAGADPSRVFQEEALRHVHRATSGVPRLINQLCNHTMIMATVKAMAPISPALVDEAWADLQQLPTPWAESKPNASSSKVVEFGGLVDAREELPNAIPFQPRGARAFGMLEPEARLEQIEENLSAIDEELGAVGSQSRHVELAFPDVCNPFSECFEDEEVVLDRYASEGIDLFGDLPPVASDEGRRLATMLEPFVRRDIAATSVALSSPQAPAAKTRSAGDARDRDHAASIIVGIQAVSAGIDLSLSSVLPPGHEANAASANRPVPSTSEGTAAAQGEASTAPAPADDDVILIEDDVTGTLTPPIWPRVRRPEYRQLFAKLRRG